MLAVSAAGLDDRYTLEKESVSGQLAELLCSILFQPAFENSRFRQEDIGQEKRQLIEQIDSEFNEKRIYAKNRCEGIDVRRRGLRRGPVRYQRSRWKPLTGEEIYAAWLRALSQARIELMMVGGSDPQKAIDGFQKRLGRSIGKKSCLGIPRWFPSGPGQEFHDVMDGPSQAGDGLPFEHRRARRRCDGYAGDVRPAGWHPPFKLFLNVREKLSLCYYCSSSYDGTRALC